MKKNRVSLRNVLLGIGAFFAISSVGGLMTGLNSPPTSSSITPQSTNTVPSSVSSPTLSPAAEKIITNSQAPSTATTYTNSAGNTVYSPSQENYGNATAQCRDGTYSYSQNHSGTCSHHGGVATWY